MFVSSSTNPVQAQRDRITLGLLTFFFGMFIATLIVLWVLGARTEQWQYYVLAGAAFLFSISIGIAFQLTRLGKYRNAAIALISMLVLAFVVSAAVTTGVGDLLSFMLTIIGLLIVSQLLSGREFVWGVVSVLAGAALVTLASLFVNIEIDVTAASNLLAGVLAFLFLGFITLLFLQFGNYSISAKLTATYLIVALLPVSALVFYFTSATRAALTEQADSALLGASRQVAGDVDAFLQNGLDNVTIQASLPDLADYLQLPADQRDTVINGGTEELNTILSSFASQDPNISSIGLLDAKGTVLADTDESEIGTGRSDRDYFQQVVQTQKAYTSPAEYSQTTGKYVVFFAAPVFNDGGKLIGVLRTRHDAANLQEILASANDLVEAGSYAVLFDENFLRLAQGNSTAPVGKTFITLDPQTFSALQVAGRLPAGVTAEEISTNQDDFKAGLESGPIFTAYSTSINGSVIYATTKLTAQPDWTIVYAQAVKTLYAPVAKEAANASIASLIISALVAILALTVTRQLSNPVLDLTQTARQVAAGDLTVRAAVESNDEVGELAETFNDMTSEILQRTKAVETSIEVSRRISSILNMSELVTEVVEQLQSAFNYYHAHIYLTDETNGNLLMAGGTGEAGATLLRNGHMVQKGRGLVGRAAETKEFVLVPDTLKDPSWLPNPLLPETKSEIAVPILAGDQVLGVLDVQNNVTDSLSEQDADLIRSIANQVAVATLNVRQYEATKKAEEAVTKRAKELELASQVSTAATTIVETDKLLQEVVDLTKDAFGLYHTHIYLLNEVGNTLELTSGAGDVGKQMVSERRSIPLNREQSLVARAAREKESFFVNDVRSDPDFLPHPLLPDTRSELAVPLVVGNQVLGVFDVQSDELNHFSDEDIRIQSTLAAQIAVALQNTRQYAETQRRASELELVADVSTAVTTIIETEKLLQEVVDLTKESFGLYHAHIYLLDEASDTLNLVSGAGDVGKKMVSEGRQILLNREQSLVARAAREKEGFFVNDVRSDPDFLPHPLLPNTRSELAVPMVVGNKAIGVLDVQSAVVNHFTENDIRIQTTLASQVAVALQNARTFEQAQRQAERESMLNMISQKIQNATTVDSVLQIAARELGRALDASRAVAQLGMGGKVGEKLNGNGHHE